MKQRTYNKNILLGMAILLFLAAGCNLPFSGVEREEIYYVLGSDVAPPEEESSLQAKLPLVLLVRDAKASGLINSHKILFRPDSTTEGYYHFASWTELPAKRFTTLLIQKLERAQLFRSVSREASAPRGDARLQTELLDFSHDISNEPGLVRIIVRAEFVDFKEARIVANKYFSATVAVKTFNVQGAVEAFGQALDQILDDIVKWLQQIA